MISGAILLFLVATSCMSQAAPECGGHLEANDGELAYSDEEAPHSTCVWILHLHSTQNFNFKLNSIDANSLLGLYTKKQIGTPFPLVPPQNMLNSSNIEQTIVYVDNSLVFLVLPPSDEPRSFSALWWGSGDGAHQSELELVSYLDSSEGQVTVSAQGTYILAYVLNPSASTINVGANIVGFENDCAPLVYTLYEITEAGHLKELARTCGPSMELQNLRSPIIAIAYKLDLDSGFKVQLKWSSNSAPTPTTTATTNEPMTTTKSPDSGCGGELFADYSGFISYRETEVYGDNELCIWSLRVHRDYRNILVRLDSDGFQGDEAFILVSSFGYNAYSNTQANLDVVTIKGGNRTEIQLDGPLLLVTFRSTKGGGHGFHLTFTRSTPLTNSPWKDHNYTQLHYDESKANITFPVGGGNYRRGEFATFVINPHLPNYAPEFSQLFVELTYTSIEGYNGGTCHDRVNLITFNMDRNVYSTYGSYCGSWTGVRRFNSNGPILLVFRSRVDSARGGGFRSNYYLM